MIERISPDWGHIPGVQAFCTTRRGGVSQAAWDSLNLGAHCGDSPLAVVENRRRLGAELPAAPRWLKQVHGTDIIHLDQWQDGVQADAAWTDRPGQVAVVLTADCLPILISHRSGGLVAAVHAGWRGLHAGILAATIRALPAAAADLLAWIGPSISQSAYEVDAAFAQRFIMQDKALAAAFRPGQDDHFFADLKAIAVRMLGQAGVGRVLDAAVCSASEPTRFFSFRRDRQTGRMASLIYLE